MPSKLTGVCDMLPRLPSQLEQVALKFKRKLSYKYLYLYDYITPENIIHALGYLKDNNPLYNVRNVWLSKSLLDDANIVCSLVDNPL